MTIYMLFMLLILLMSLFTIFSFMSYISFTAAPNTKFCSSHVLQCSNASSVNFPW